VENYLEFVKLLVPQEVHHRHSDLISFVQSATVSLFGEREIRNVNVYVIQIKNIVLQNRSL
jgi:hypothetical protein